MVRGWLLNQRSNLIPNGSQFPNEILAIIGGQVFDLLLELGEVLTGQAAEIVIDRGDE